MNRETRQTTGTVKIRYPCGQCRTRRIDEAAALACDSVRVSNDDIGTTTEDFSRPLKGAAIAARHFIENNGSWTTILQIGIARRDATQFRGSHLTIVVVEDQAGIADIEVVILVMRQPLPVRRYNIDQRDTIWRGTNTRLVANWRACVGCDLRLNEHWLEYQKSTQKRGDRLTRNPGCKAHDAPASRGLCFV